MERLVDQEARMSEGDNVHEVEAAILQIEARQRQLQDQVQCAEAKNAVLEQAIDDLKRGRWAFYATKDFIMISARLFL